MPDLTILAEVLDQNRDGENRSCVVITVDRREVSRVAFARRHSANPDVGFVEALDGEIAKARTAVERINELYSAAGELR